MEEKTKQYTKGDLTVIWKPEQCIHSTVCWKGLIKVFNPRARPWVNMDGADTERIAEQVAKCPSGALSYIKTATEEIANSGEKEITTSVEAMKNGPLIIYGNLKVKDSKGNEHTRSNVTAFCRCGASGNKPFCDGSHMKIGFRDGQE
jgi:uncharacterized Fe-S cluster protein YjdI